MSPQNFQLQTLAQQGELGICAPALPLPLPANTTVPDPMYVCCCSAGPHYAQPHKQRFEVSVP